MPRLSPRAWAKASPRTRADVFDRVVIVDVRVAGGDDVEIDAAVAGDHVEHVREKADRRLDARVRAVAVEVRR